MSDLALRKLAHHINSLNERIGKSSAWLNLVLVLLVSIDVIRRYLFQATDTWIIELEWHLFALIFLLGSAYTLKHDAHVRVDLFYERMEEGDRRIVDFWGHLIFLLPWTAMMAYLSWQFAYDSWIIREGSPNPNGLPARYIIKFVMCLGFVLLFLQAFAQMILKYPYHKK